MLTPKPEILAEDKIIEAWPLKITAEDVSIVPVKEMFTGETAKSSVR